MAQGPSGLCGACGAFTAYGDHASLGRVGTCARQMRSYPVTVGGTCGEFRARGTAAEPIKLRPKLRTPASGPARSQSARTLPQEVDLDMDMESFRAVLSEVLREELGIGEVSLGGRWEGGELVLKPGKEGTAEKRVPIETFFHKIVMLRDRLRVLEQRINGHAALTDEDKVAMQQYVTACYGTLTTFNVLFAEPVRDGFRGASTDK